MEPEGSLPHSQQPTICSYPEVLSFERERERERERDQQTKAVGAIAIVTQNRQIHFHMV